MANITDIDRWDEIKVQLRKKYIDLIESDFVYAEGKREVMMAKLAEKMGKTKQQLNQIIAFIL